MMTIFESTPDTHKFYIELCLLLNRYIQKWIDVSLKVQSSVKKIEISTDVLLTLFKLFDLSGTHQVGKTLIQFNPLHSNKRALELKSIKENFKCFIAQKYELESNFGIDIDWAPRVLDYKYDTSKNLIDRIYSTEFREWYKPELFSIFKIIETIHQSFLELIDDSVLLRSYIENYQINPFDFKHRSSFYVSWRVIPNLAVLSSYDESIHKENIIYFQLVIIVYSQ